MQVMDKVITRLKAELYAQSVMVDKSRPVQLPIQVTPQAVDVAAVSDRKTRIGGIYTHTRPGWIYPG